MAVVISSCLPHLSGGTQLLVEHDINRGMDALGQPLLDLFAALLTSKQWQPARSCSLFHGEVSWRFQQPVGWFCLIGDAASFNFCKASLAFLAHSGPGSRKRLYQSSTHILVVVKNGHPDTEEASSPGDLDHKSSDVV